MAMNKYIGKSNFWRTTTPMTGYKKTLLTVNSGKIYLQSIQGPDGHRENLPLTATSACPFHPKAHFGKPSRNCACGFYSYTSIADAMEHLASNTSYFIIRTVASGKIVLYEKGVRSGVQRVEEVHVGTCETYQCTNPADRVKVEDHPLNGRKFVYPVCYAHGLLNANCKTFTWLENHMNKGFENGEPDIKVYPQSALTKPWDGKIIPGFNITVSDTTDKPGINVQDYLLSGIYLAAIVAAMMLLLFSSLPLLK